MEPRVEEDSQPPEARKDPQLIAISEMEAWKELNSANNLRQEGNMLP